MCTDRVESYLQTDEARVLALGLFQDGSGLLPHVGALLHSHEQNVGFVSLFESHFDILRPASRFQNVTVGYLVGSDSKSCGIALHRIGGLEMYIGLRASFVGYLFRAGCERGTLLELLSTFPRCLRAWNFYFVPPKLALLTKLGLLFKCQTAVKGKGRVVVALKNDGVSQKSRFQRSGET